MTKLRTEQVDSCTATKRRGKGFASLKRQERVTRTSQLHSDWVPKGGFAAGANMVKGAMAARRKRPKREARSFHNILLFSIERTEPASSCCGNLRSCKSKTNTKVCWRHFLGVFCSCLTFESFSSALFDDHEWLVAARPVVLRVFKGA